jgi:hypothetical protein
MAQFHVPPFLPRTASSLTALVAATVLSFTGAANASFITQWQVQSSTTQVTLSNSPRYNGTAATMVTSGPINMNVPVGTLPGDIVDMFVTIDMRSTQVGDLTIKLVGPDGTVAAILNRPGTAWDAQFYDDGRHPGSGSTALLEQSIPITYQDLATATNSETHLPFARGTSVTYNSQVYALVTSGTMYSEEMGSQSGGTYVGLTGAAGTNPNNYYADDAGSGLGTLSNFYGLTASTATSNAWSLELGVSGGSVGTLYSWTLGIETAIDPVPEPASLVVLALGGASLLARRRIANGGRAR